MDLSHGMLYHLVGKHGPINNIADGIHIARRRRLELVVHLDAASGVQLNAHCLQAKPLIERPPPCSAKAASDSTQGWECTRVDIWARSGDELRAYTCCDKDHICFKGL